MSACHKRLSKNTLDVYRLTKSLIGSENSADHAWDFLSNWFNLSFLGRRASMHGPINEAVAYRSRVDKGSIKELSTLTGNAILQLLILSVIYLSTIHANEDKPTRFC